MSWLPWYDGPIWQGFKWKWSDTHAHSGIDIGNPNGTPVTAPMSGTIISQGFEPWGGQVNELVQTSSGPEVLSFLHLSGLSPHMGHVDKGARIGSSGTPPPGYGKGAHVHFEQTHGATPPYMGYNPWYPTKNSFPLDPTGLLNSLRGGGGGGGGGTPPNQPPGGGGINYCDPTQLLKALADCKGDKVCEQNVMSAAQAAGCGGPLSNPLDGVSQAISNFQTGAADALKRAAVFMMAGSLAVAGVYLMLKPQIDGAVHDAVRGAETAAVAAV